MSKNNTRTITVIGSGEILRDPEWMVSVEGQRAFVCRATSPKAAVSRARDNGVTGNVRSVVKVGD